MLNIPLNFPYLLSIGIVISLLHGYTCYGIYNNNISESIWFNLSESIGVSNFLKQNQEFLNQEIPDMTPQFGDTFDFIVIGGGTAGATIAARLSEISQVKILLIESGFQEDLFMDIPLLAPNLQMNNTINWIYRSKSSNKYCQGMIDNKCRLSSGKVVGGSSVLNFMIANRGAAEDYDRWAEMGNDGWAYKDVLKYFKKLETMDIPKLKSDIAYHGIDGPIHITSPLFHTPLADAFLETGKKMGYPLIDYNGKNEIGFSFLQTTIMNGARMSSNRAYLHPVRDRNNLYMTFRSTVTKILIDPRTKRAIGVKFTKNDRNISVFASKEVILCAGAIKSPQLLMLSGIGSAKHLNKLGIDVIQDAPVGKNLMDHPTFYGLSWIINGSISLSELLNPSNPYLTQFLINQTGPFTLPGGSEAVGFINTKDPKEHSGRPDIELLFFGNTIKSSAFLELLNLKDSISYEWAKYANSSGWSIGTVLLQPKSRGRIMLLSKDINVKPEITPNYFNHPDDVKTMIAGLRIALSIGRTKTMQAFDSQFLNLTYMECDNYEHDTNVYWECMIRTLSSTIYHYSGTCKMGARGDPTAVVDPTLKVIGIQGLRVSDASIMPEIVSGHTSIPVYMIAEKAADMIKEDWGYLEKPR